MPLTDAHFGGFSIFLYLSIHLFAMQYQKNPITVIEQIEKLQSRGLRIDNLGKAAHFLSNISYLRQLI